VEPMTGNRLLSWRGEGRLVDVDLAEVKGMEDPRYAIEVAAAGGHHVLLTGPKGAGKTTLAERIPGILPDLTVEEALELTAIHSLAGALEPGDDLISRPPYCAPHSSASRASLLGGGTGKVRPGDVSRAHCGVLFMDEFPLFASDVIEALRQPLESGDITISRGDETATYPARGMFVFACNPCPCGMYSVSPGASKCECREVERREYRRKMSGPVIDRIDITRHVVPLGGSSDDGLSGPPESTARVRARVEEARDRQRLRFRDDPWRTNAQVPGPRLTDRWPLTRAAEKMLDRELYAGGLTRRGATRVHRLAWTVADLDGVDRPGIDELDVAVRLRTGAPLLLSTTQQRYAG